MNSYILVWWDNDEGAKRWISFCIFFVLLVSWLMLCLFFLFCVWLVNLLIIVNLVLPRGISGDGKNVMIQQPIYMTRTRHERTYYREYMATTRTLNRDPASTQPSEKRRWQLVFASVLSFYVCLFFFRSARLRISIISCHTSFFGWFWGKTGRNREGKDEKLFFGGEYKEHFFVLVLIFVLCLAYSLGILLVFFLPEAALTTHTHTTTTTATTTTMYAWFLFGKQKLGSVGKRTNPGWWKHWTW